MPKITVYVIITQEQETEAETATMWTQTITAYAIITQEQEAEPDTAEADTTEVDTTEDAIDRVIDKKSNKKDNLQAGTCKVSALCAFAGEG